MNKYASPGLTPNAKAHETTYCVNKPANGALKGLFEAKKEE